MLDIDQVEQVVRAREAFVTEGLVPPPAIVRPLIFDSWKRSRLYGLDPRLVRPVEVVAIERDNQLTRAARPIVASRLDWLTDLECGLTLTNSEGIVLETWSSATRFAERLHSRFVLPGFSIAESAIGTTSAGIALETGESIMVAGPEQFSDKGSHMASAGVPIRHPLTQRRIGTLNLSCDVKDASPVMLHWIKEVASLVEKQILGSVSHDERLLLDVYLTGKRDSRHPLVCLNDHTLIGNAAAARLMDGIDQALLWEAASDAIQSRGESVFSVPSSDHEEPITVRCQPIFNGDQAVGAMLRMDSPLFEGASARTGSGRVVDQADILPGQPGRSLAWRTFCAQLGEAVQSERSIMLVGETGVGKTTILHELVGSGSVCTLDAGSLDTDAPGTPTEWLTALADALRSELEHIVLDNIHLVPARLLATTKQAIRTASRAGGPTVLAAASYEFHQSMDANVLAAYSDWPGATVRVPPVRERLGDLPLLLNAIAAERATGPNRPVWTRDAVQVLGRMTWPGNLQSLASLVNTMLRKQTGPYIRRQDLPTEIIAGATRRELSTLERLEAQAIIAAMGAAQGNKKLAADSLGIARSTLYRKVRALGLDLDRTAY
ncbi:MAG: helix-turn-helix domain-containing protein [Aeromicrobium sp.]